MAPQPLDLRFWGKAQPEAASGAPYHPVAYHLLDVAASAEAILAARPILRARAGTLLGLSGEEASRLLVALIALHDLGKFAPAFQSRCVELWPVALGPCDPRGVHSSAHTDDGQTLWTHELERVARPRLWPRGANALRAISPAIFGHHGRPPRDDLYGPTARAAMSTPGLHAALSCADVVLALLHPVPVGSPDLTAEESARASWWVAGLTTLADWVGSNQRWFPYAAPLENDPTLAEYWARARAGARDAVRAAGLRAPSVAPTGTFTELTSLDAATPLQQWASDVVLPDGPVLVIIEDVTGAGKTEAAHMLVHRRMTSGCAAGAYWAMPTQATANAMYARQSKLLDVLYRADDACRPSLVLSHGQQRLHETFRATVLDGAAAGAEARHPNAARDKEAPSTATCAAFLADDRRAALLADVGAGTVDQALLGVLPSKFNALRLFGLSDKVLVVDEAHAYDAYMDVELEELLRFHAALGGSAIILSATLPRQQRERMASAWTEGLDGGRRRLLRGDASEMLTRSAAYPLATVVAQGNVPVHERPLDAAEWSKRHVGVRFVHEMADAVAHVVAAHERGGAVAWVRNTVDDCLAAAQALRDRGMEPLVFHARFAQGDRQRLEEKIVRLFGKDSPASARRGRVLVATQVIEQSLDLDFDAMVSDVAPVDLLVQRAGRLWRHPRRNAERPAGLICELVVLTPPFAEQPEKDWLGPPFVGTAKVYEDAGVLWRTVQTLRDARAIDTPHGLRALIEKVYGSDDVPDALCKAADVAKGKERANASAANFATLNVADGYDAGAHGWTSELRATTRLGDRQTTVRLARVLGDGTLAPWIESDGPAWKAWALSEVRLSRWKVPAGSTAEPRFDAAVQSARADWGKWEQKDPVLPLEPIGAGQFAGILHPPGAARPRRIVYHVARGLSYPADQD